MPRRTTRLLLLLLATVSAGLAIAPRAGARPKAPAPYHWATGDDVALVVDVLQMQGDPNLLEKLAQRYGDRAAGGQFVPIPTTEKLLPRFPQMGDKVTLVSVLGVAKTAVIGFGIKRGTTEIHLQILLEPVKGVSEALVVIGGKVAPGAKLLAVPKLDPRQPGLPERLNDVRSVLLAKSRGKAAGLLGKLKLGARHVQIVPGRFGPSSTTLVSLAVPRRKQEVLSALAFLDEVGLVSAIVEAPQVGLRRYPLRALVDVDGDGVDEVLYTSAYDKGAYQMLAKWDGEAWRQIVLAGDGE